MRLSATLSIYIGRLFLGRFLGVLVILLLLILMIDTIELLRRSASLPNVSFTMVLEMALLKLPYMGQQSFPFAALFGGMSAFWRLTRNSELVVTRAAGVSAWQFLAPILMIAFFMGVVKITLVNPLASITLSRYERLESIRLRGQRSLFAISDSGIWLRQVNDLGQSVIHSKTVLQQGKDVELNKVVVFIYEGKDQFKSRINAEKARLEKGFWHMTNAWIMQPDRPPQFEKEYWIATDLTLSKIQDSFAPPETMSFWNLPEFIKTMELAGFSATRHRLHWNALLAAPFMMCAMVLIAAVFTFRQVRMGSTAFVVGGGMFSGFVVYFFSDVVFALGLSDSIPVVLAAWTPAGVTTLLGVSMLLHLEDG